MGTKEIASVTVVMSRIDGGGELGSTTCAPLAPTATCTVIASTALDQLRLCSVTGKGNLKALRGRF